MQNEKLPRNVIFLSITSFFNDVASEMIYPIVPLFLTNVLGAPVTIVGVIEGIAEFIANFLKVFSGWISDVFQKRKPLTVIGYSISALSKFLLGLAYFWQVVLIARVADKLGKGIRTAPRDALICESTDIKIRGKAFGFHRGLDSFGAVVGPLIALLLIKFLTNDLRLIFFLSVIPSILGVIFLSLFVKEPKKISKIVCKTNITSDEKKFPKKFILFLIVSAIFSIGNSSDAFLILRAQSLNFSFALVLALYILFNVSYTLFSLPAGIVSDKIGPRRILILGFFLFAFVYLFFGIPHTKELLWILFPIYGLYMALTEGISKAYISQMVHTENVGLAIGLHQTVTGISILIASIIAGILWTTIGPSVPFIFGSFTAILSALIFIIVG